MKRILFLQNSILHYRRPVYNELSKYYDVTVLHSGGGTVGTDDTYREIIVPSKKFGAFYFQSGVLKTIGKGDYDAVIAMFDIHWICNIVAGLVRSNCRFIYWGHRYSKSRLGNRLRDLLMRSSDSVVLYSDSEIDRMVSRSIPASKIFVAPNTIAVPNHADGSRSNKCSFIFSGRAQKRKKVNLLIKAFSEILYEIPEDTKIIIVGSGQENDSLRALSNHLGVGRRVIFHGEVLDNEKLKTLFHSAYAYVSPGPVGLGLLHSFAYGVPVVTNSLERHGPELDNIVNGENGLLYMTYDELKQILITLCNDKSLTERLGRNAYLLYSKERTITKMVDGFRQAIE